MPGSWMRKSTQMISHIHVITVLKILQEIMILPGLIRFTHICHINAISVLKLLQEIVILKITSI